MSVAKDADNLLFAINLNTKMIVELITTKRVKITSKEKYTYCIYEIKVYQKKLILDINTQKKKAQRVLIEHLRPKSLSDCVITLSRIYEYYQQDKRYRNDIALRTYINSQDKINSYITC